MGSNSCKRFTRVNTILGLPELKLQQNPLDLLLQTGLVNRNCRDAFCRRIIFPCRQQGRLVNLYGRSIGSAFPHRLLPGSKGELFAWESVRSFSSVILVEACSI